jgi:hypothetical protein
MTTWHILPNYTGYGLAGKTKNSWLSFFAFNESVIGSIRSDQDRRGQLAWRGMSKRRAHATRRHGRLYVTLPSSLVHSAKPARQPKKRNQNIQPSVNVKVDRSQGPVI